MSSCSNCHAPLASGVRFCAKCGTRVEATPAPKSSGSFCTKCGKALAQGVAFCSGCGTRQVAAPTPKGQSRPQVPTRTPPTRPSSFGAKTGSQGPIRGPVLYVTAKGAMDEQSLRKLINNASAANKGSLLIVDASTDPVAAVQKATGECLRRRVKLEAVCLLGSDDTLPHHRFDDPCGQDENLPTDAPYGMARTPNQEERFQGLVLPQIPVCRIPFDNADQIQPFLVIGAELCDSWDDGLAVTAQVWTGASAAVLAAINPSGDVPLHAVPPKGPSQIGSEIKSTTGRCYFNVHGSDQTTAWFGEGNGQQPEAFEPELVKIAPRGIAISEACYGALIDEYGEGISLSFLQAGAGCFVGSTIIAWGPTTAPIGLADEIVTGFYGALDQGTGVAKALVQAKEEMLKRYQHSDGSWSLEPAQHNTLLSFIAYGSPCATVRASQSKGFRPNSVRGSKPGGSDVLSKVRARMAGQGDGSTVLEQVMSRLESRVSGETFRILNQGRVDLSAPPPGLPDMTQVRNRIAEKLGQLPTQTHVFQSSGGNQDTSVFGKAGEGTKAKIVAMVVNQAGQIIAEYSSR